MTSNILNSHSWFSSYYFSQEDIIQIVMTTTLIGFFGIILLFYITSSSSEVRGFMVVTSPKQQQHQQKQQSFAATRTLSSNISELGRRMSEVSDMIEKEWNSLAPPFQLNNAPSPYSSSATTMRGSTSNVLSNSQEQQQSNQEEEHTLQSDNDEDVDVTHFCFLVHGHKGFAKDLSYIEQIMRQLWFQRRNKEKEKISLAASAAATDETTATGAFEKNNNDEEEYHPPPIIKSRLVVHNVECNEKKTDDGVANGGNRLLDEMLSVIRHEMHTKNAKKKDDKAMEDKEETTTANQQLYSAESPSLQEQVKVQGVKHKVNDKKKQNGDDVQEITISMVGNSLGGIYSRYAIAKLAELAEQEDSASNAEPMNARNNQTTTSFLLTLDDQVYRMHFNVFCTTASPHLGISKHTYLPLPRQAEIGVARVLGTTGHDLFRLNDLMKEMATTSKFLNPLAAFRKRVAYANAFRTDFPVPAETAAFLHDQSRYPHHFAVDETEGESDDYDSLVVDDSGLIIATLHTPPKAQYQNEQKSTRISSTTNNDGKHTEGEVDEELSSRHSSMPPLDAENTDELIQMSTSLDSLGWKKVFVDLRRHSPSVDIPSIPGISPSLARITTKAGSLKSFFRNNSSPLADDQSTTNNTPSESNDNNGTMTAAKADSEKLPAVADKGVSGKEATPVNDQQQLLQQCPVQSLRQKQIVESKDVMAAFRDPVDKRFSLPIGHNMICAFSRGRLSTYLNKGGRPVMDTLAKELVEDIFTWTPPQGQ